MEGVCGVVSHDEWVTPQGRYYEEGNRLLTLEINAAVEGFIEAGGSEFLVIDGHGYGGIQPELLHPHVQYCRGPWPGPSPFMLDESFDAIAWVGQHAKAGTEYAHMAHTGSMNVTGITSNGISRVLYGAVNPRDIQRGQPNNDFLPEAKPQEGEGGAATSQQLFALSKH